MEFGKTLRMAREAKGLTVGHLAETTKLAPAIINDLENEVFSKISAPIYGRGFVKLYCEAVGLEPKPLVDEFMAIINGTHEPSIRERPPSREDDGAVVDSQPEPAPAPHAAPPETDTPLQQTQPNLFSPEPVSGTIPPPPVRPPFNSDQSFSRYAAPLREDETPHQAPSRAFWRLGVLGAAAILILVLLFWGISALYHATSADKATTVDETTTTPTETTPANAPRTPQKIPSLYID